MPPPGQLHFVEEREAFVASQRNVLPPDYRHRVAVAQRIVVVHLEVEVRILAAEVEVGLVELEQRARVDEASSDGHVVA